MRQEDSGEMNEFQGEFETLVMTDEDGVDTQFAIIDVVDINDIRYYLVAEVDRLEDEDDLDAALLKEVSSDEEEAIFEFVTDDAEIESVYAILCDSEDYDIEL